MDMKNTPLRILHLEADNGKLPEMVFKRLLEADKNHLSKV